MKLSDFLLNRDPVAASDYPPALTYATPEVCAEFYPHIWEPSNRKTFARKDIRSRMERDPNPIPHEDNRDEYFSRRQLEYWVSGLTDALAITSWIQGDQGDFELRRVLDFGCSSGRVLRHFRSQGLADEIYGADLNTRCIRWGQDRLPGIVFFNNSVIPHLPFPDGFFDLVTAYSVFTHIDLFEEAWLLELRRITRPGGYAALSNHSEHVWAGIDADHFMYPTLKRGKPTIDVTITPEIFTSPMPAERFGFSRLEGVANEISMFRSRDYIRERWGALFEIRDIVPGGHLFHDLVIMRAP